MANLAAVITEAKASLEDEIIAFHPVEWKIAKLAIFPLQYPAILGSFFGGRVEAVGPQVTRFKVGDKVAAAKKFGAVGNHYGAYQRYVVAWDSMASKVPEGTDVTIPASLTGNLGSVIGLFTANAGLDKPSLDGFASAKNSKVLIYGGSSSFGSLSVQYVSEAGYTVVTTSSPNHKEFVSKLGAVKVVDHTQEQGALVEALVSEGPYDLIVHVDLSSLAQMCILEWREFATPKSVGGTAYFSFLLLVVQYFMGPSEDTNLDGFANPVDEKLLSFIWRYFQANPGIRMLRMILMILLAITLAIALLPTGGACGLQNGYTRYNDGVYPGAPAKCCFLLMGRHHGFIPSDGPYIVLLVVSEVLLIISSSTRVIKLFQTSSDFSRMWLRHKPAQLCKQFVRKLEEKRKRSSRGLTRLIYHGGHCTIIAFILLARAIYDLTDSILWEISWLLFSLAWGTVRTLGIESYDAPREITNKEGLWGFGQFVPTLLLIIPLVSLIEGVLGSNNPKTSDCASVSSNSTSDITASNNATVAESEEELGLSGALPTGQPSCDDSNRTASISMAQRTTTGLIDMEYSLGISADNIHGSATGSQSGVDQEHPTRPITPESPTQSLLWPAEVLYEHDFYTDVWYTDMIACILILVYACGGIIVSASSTDSGRESVVMFITPPYGLTTLCTFCLVSDEEFDNYKT
ncbi:hypothetical protein V501_06376 [Pseudogymnoascus sp. VKM F-4519 (FW-2642)]|nr:hypothetical protein V501_06376 [Pseudogymnoascus sp. VKM F-4519 (FW-2642)]